MISENPDYDFYEIWLGYIKDLDTDFIWKISEQLNGKLVFIFRKQNSEKSDLDKGLKEKIIKLLESSDNLLDFDINSGSWGLEYIKENKLQNKLIASFHDYEKTPELDDLKKIVKDMERYKPEIYKVSTFCKTPEDALKLLNLSLVLKKGEKKFLIFGMGEEGTMVRIYAALWGNEFNFAPSEDDEKSAPGQLTKSNLDRALNLLKNLNSGSSPQ
jgi:3-dehydroquinate dehydratase type I